MSMEEIIKKFCKRCGSPLGMYVSDRFDEYTGEKVNYLACTNPKCEEHCGQVVEHIWGKAWKFQNWEKCQRCGYVIQDY